MAGLGTFRVIQPQINLLLWKQEYDFEPGNWKFLDIVAKVQATKRKKENINWTLQNLKMIEKTTLTIGEVFAKCVSDRSLVSSTK